MRPSTVIKKSITAQTLGYIWMTLGAFLAAFSIEIFLFPNKLIDGGVIGIAMIFSYIFGPQKFPIFLIIFTFPFLLLAYKYIGKVFLLHMLFAVMLFVGSIILIRNYVPFHFDGESLEFVVIGGAILGIGIGLIIRYGGCLDGTEILGIIINRNIGITVGQVVLFCNVFIFGAVGLVFKDWHPPLLSLIMFMVATKVMDAVIVGLEETKSVWIISPNSKEIANSIIHELGLGLTIMYGRGGFSGDEREILYVITERLQLAELKELVYQIDPSAFVAIENLHEVSNGTQGDTSTWKQKRIEKLISRIFRPA
ncbi:MAG: YitT family protein [Waddliaceae bacterium]